MKTSSFLILLMGIALGSLNAADGEKQLPQREITGTMEEQIPPSPSPVPVEEVKEGFPEVPQVLEDRKLTAGEAAELDDLEHDFAEGRITQTEYEMEKDKLVRKANIQF